MKKLNLNLLLLAGAFSLLSCMQKAPETYEAPLNEAWEIFSSAEVRLSGEEISVSSFSGGELMKADIPATVMSALIQNGKYADIFLGDNLEKIDKKQFEAPWWYRKTFEISSNSDKEFYQLIFEGLNYKANIFLNGKKIGDQKEVEGPFAIHTFDVSDYLVSGKNILAVEVIPPVTGDLTIGFVDWNPGSPDRNMGLWRGVILKKSGEISMRRPNVITKVNTRTLKEAELTFSTFVRNHSASEQQVTVKAVMESLQVSKEVKLAAGEEKEVVFSPKEFPKLKIKNPRLWWPVNLGDPNLYDLTFSASVNKEISDSKKIRFGIRQVDAYKNDEGHLGFKINGKNILVKGAGWVDDIFLADSDEKVRAQVDYVKHMNLNTIRLEGFWGKNKTLYDRADEQGILLMIGWSCQWEWEGYCGRYEDEYLAIREPEEQEKQAGDFMDQVYWLRTHPSVFMWNFGSDKLPRPELEKLLHNYFVSVDTTRYLLSHCGSRTSELTGPSGVKMHGPYDWVPPVYWHQDKKYGGAYGFNTETGPGPQVPPLESLRKMIPEDKLWPVNSIWEYHCGRNEFQTLDRFLKAFNARYGEAKTLEEFVFKNQISNYEGVRAMFDAFAINRPNTTGLIQWMLNSAWPEMYWQLYDYYLMPNGAFYGTKKAAAPLMPLYNYNTKTVHVHNEYLQTKEKLTLKATVFDINSKELLKKDIPFSIDATSSKQVFEIPKISNLTQTYFLDLRLTDANGKEIANNFYWLSTVEEVMDYDKTTWVYTPAKKLGDYTGINNIPQAETAFSYSKKVEGDEIVVECNLRNNSNVIAFFIELSLKEVATGITVLPVFWDDNYVTLLPGESRIIKARINKGTLKEEDLDLEIKGWNLGIKNEK